MFRLICKLKAMDDDSLLSSKESEPFRTNFPVRKKELVARILQVLRGRQKVDGIEKNLLFRVHEAMEDITFLRSKGLFTYAQRRLADVKAQAEAGELHVFLLEISSLERNFIRLENGKDMPGQLRELHQRNEELCRILQNKYRMVDLKDRVLALAMKHSNLTAAALPKEVEELMTYPELKDISLCLSFDARSDFYTSHSTYQYLVGNEESAWEYAKNLYLLWLGHPGVKALKPVGYTNAIHNFLVLSNSVLRYEYFDKALAELEDSSSFNQEATASAVQNLLFIQLQKHLNLCDWALALGVFEEFKAQKEKFVTHLSKRREMAFYISFSRMFMALGEWQKAARWARNAVDADQGLPTQGLVFQALLQELIAFYELGDVQRLEKHARSLLETHNPDRAIPDFERRLLGLLRRSITKPADDKFLQEIKGLLDEAATLAAERELSLRLVIAWLRAKQRACGLADVLREDMERQLAALK